MENKERKNLELTDDQLEQANGGTTNGGSHEVLFPSPRSCRRITI